MRAFLAIELPEETRQAITALRDRLRQAGASASWVKPENYHLTLRFFGDIEEEAIVQLAQYLAPYFLDCQALSLRFAGVGAFPSLRRPAVLWAGIQVVEGDLDTLHQVAERGARNLELTPETKAFHPHVTLARVRDHRKLGHCREELERCAGIGADAFLVRSVALFSSQLHPGGAIYRRIQEFPLS